jgi:hypothetical protein
MKRSAQDIILECIDKLGTATFDDIRDALEEGGWENLNAAVAMSRLINGSNPKLVKYGDYFLRPGKKS